ncbi:MAG: HlyD family efflux transporter periplasmic adaptor subunit [Candidatus Protistobacter heckmanni]|nr:HlyD family efflux transporter periplasmic adaptor subunit [Candidatus Protistobacter heckmanni]
MRAELKITEPLLASGDVGQAEVIRLKRAEAELTGQIVNLRRKYFQDAQADMTKAEEELAAAEQVLHERFAVLGYNELRAPMDGQIKKINITTLGAAVRQGDTVLEMRPTGSELIVEAKFSPADVASLRTGLPASVKLDAYDYSIYGSIDGEVTYISPDALSEPDPCTGQQSFYYRVHLRLASPPQHAGPRGDPIVINPGMTAHVEVRTRDRTVFSYLTKPITKTLSEAMNER